jgi:hypothetical protein
MKKLSEPPSLVRRLLRVNPERLRRHGAYWLASLRCGAERFFGTTYPRWIDAISTSMTLNEKQTLYDLARGLPRGSVAAEIGSYYGASSCCLAAVLRSRGGRLWCVDTWMNDAVSDARADVFPLWQKHTRLLSEGIKPVRGKSHEVATRIPDELSLLFVDGDHSYDGVRRDLLLYLPKMREDGVLVMHDWGLESVQRAIKELVLPHERARLTVLPNLYSCRVAFQR